MTPYQRVYFRVSVMGLATGAACMMIGNAPNAILALVATIIAQALLRR